MSVNNKLIRATVFALVFILTSCSGPKYLVQGLTLPPGSTEVSYDKDTNALKNSPFAMLSPGKVVHNVTVMFDCSSGWDSVAAHIDQRMQNAGYQDAMSALGSMIGMEEVASGLSETNKMMRNYTKMGGKYMVMLMNNNWMADSTGMPGMKLAGADYTLTVIEFEGDE